MMTSQRHLLALYTFGVFREPAEDPANDGFHELNDRIVPIVDRAPGLVARSGYEDEPGPPEWGTQVFPHFYVERGDGWSPSTLSLWEAPEAAMAFAYHGLHAEAVKRGREWHDAPEWPPYAVWWSEPDNRPDWTEAVARHLHLHENAPTPYVFDFKTMFTPDGEPYAMDPVRLKDYLNQAGSAEQSQTIG